MALSLEDIDAELARRQSSGGPDLEAIDAELNRRGVSPESNLLDTAKNVATKVATAAMPEIATAVQAYQNPDIRQPLKNALEIPKRGLQGIGTTLTSGIERGAEATQPGFNPRGAGENVADLMANIGDPRNLFINPAVGEIAGGAKNALSGPASYIGDKLASLEEAASGVPKQDIVRLFNSPSSLFKVGSKDAAGEAIGNAKNLAGVNPGITDSLETFTPENINKALAPDTVGKQALLDVAKANTAGSKPSVEQVGDALKYVSDKIKTGLRSGEDTSELQNTQRHLNSILENIAPKVQEARQEFAPLALRDKFLNLLPRNKNGTISKANLFYLNSMLGAGGGALGGAMGAVAGPLAGTVVRAPLTTGLLTSAAGAAKNIASQGLNVIAENPALRQVLIGVLAKIKGGQNASP